MHLLTSEEINTYCENHSSSESETLYNLRRQTHLQTELPIMLSGHLQGQVFGHLFSKRTYRKWTINYH